MNSYEKLSLELNEKIMAREELVQKGEAIKKGLKNKERQNVNAKYINFKSEAQKAIVNE